MLKAAEILERDKDKFAHLMTLEMGKPYKAAVAEAVKCTTACRYYAEHAEELLADEVIETGAKKSFVRYLPIGPRIPSASWPTKWSRRERRRVLSGISPLVQFSPSCRGIFPSGR